MGFGIFIGYRLEKWVMELSYQRVQHDTHTRITAVGDQNAYYNVIDVNFKFDVFAKGKFRPYALVGFGAPWLDIDNSRTYLDGSWSDETFKGWTANGGLGLVYYLNENWFLNAAAMYRWQRFRDIDGLHATVDAMASGMNYTMGIAYAF